MKIGIIGHFSERNGGQAVLTRTFKKKLSECENTEVVCVNTDAYHKHKAVFNLLFQSIKCMIQCDAIILIVSRNGLKFYLPFLYYLNKVLGKKIYHRVVGGKMCEEAKEHPRYVKYMRGFDVNWVEGRAQRDGLISLGISNVVEVYNFKDIEIAKVEDLPVYEKAPYRFCTFCRVTRMKGISSAIKAINMINRKYNSIVVTLDIYGPLDDDYEPDYQQEFFSLVKESNGSVTYMGCVPPEDSVSILKKYFMHIFPTVWPGEGMPGTIIDALSAGLPTIATNWHLNSEYISDGVTGYCYEWDKIGALEDKIDFCIHNSSLINRMRNDCLLEAGKFTSDKAMDVVYKTLGLSNNKG